MASSIDSARARRAISPKAAREQAAEYHGFAASVELEIDGEIFEIPNPSLLDDDQQERFNDLNAEIERICDRDDDIVYPEHTNDKGTTFPEKVVRGDLKEPYTIDGEPLKPPYNVRLAIALFGEDGYERFKAGGGRSNQIALAWGQMQREFEARRNRDAKSGGGDSVNPVVSNGNGVGPVPVPSQANR